MDIPSSVYRIQLSQECTLKHVTELLPYLFELGIEGIYTSPLFEAHLSGYDVINPNRLNPALGSHEDFEALCTQLQKNKMKFLLDVVPNHMGIKGNPWWLDVLEYGPQSFYAEFFDISWVLNPKIVLPILSAPYEEVLKKGEMKLVWDNGFWIHYFDYVLPINYPSYVLLFSALAENNEKEWLECLALAKSEEKESFIALQNQLQCLHKKNEEWTVFFNNNPDKLHEILEHQFYKLLFWKEAGEAINYRRFFNVNELVAIHIEKENVFTAHHQWIFELLAQGKVHGLRIDHPDGLYDPAQYFKRLRERQVSFIWAEKILDFREILPKNWEIDGTVGYDFLNVLSGTFVQKKNEPKMTELYNQFIDQKLSLQQVHYERRKRYIVLHMSSELNFLTARLKEASTNHGMVNNFTQAALMRACMEVMACFPVYRTYIQPKHAIHKNDRKYILYAVEMAKQKAEGIDPSVFDYIKGLLLLDYSGPEKELAIDFVLRFQQLTPIVKAKGLEDSTFFIYNRLISLNEVGGNPEYFGYTKREFHAFNQYKLRHWPYGALASSTHDTKFSEDARLRLHVLSEIPDLWATRVYEWKGHNEKYKTKQKGKVFPDLNTEYYLYQMLIAIWPADFERIWGCLNKAMREAGLYTSWHRIDESYEAAVKKFLEAILLPTSSFYRSFIPFQRRIAQYGFFNSLSAVVLKAGSCGVFDLYQGNESTQFCLMDPDNRRPVDFQNLQKLSEKDLKATITRQALTFRREHKELFLQGDYIPMKTPENSIGFVRTLNDQEVIVVAQRFFTEKEPHELENLQVPKNVKSKSFKDIFTNQEIIVHKDGIHQAELFKTHSFSILA